MGGITPLMLDAEKKVQDVRWFLKQIVRR